MQRTFYVLMIGNTASITAPTIDYLKKLCNGDKTIKYIEVNYEESDIKEIKINNFVFYVSAKDRLMPGHERESAFALIDTIGTQIANQGASQDREWCEKIMLEEAGLDNIKWLGLHLNCYKIDEDGNEIQSEVIE